QTTVSPDSSNGAVAQKVRLAPAAVKSTDAAPALVKAKLVVLRAALFRRAATSAGWLPPFRASAELQASGRRPRRWTRHDRKPARLACLAREPDALRTRAPPACPPQT